MEHQTQYGQQAYVSGQPQFVTQGEQPVSVGEWIISLLITFIPLLGIIMVFVWAFGDGKESKKNFFKAYLIAYAAAILLIVLMSVAFGAFLVSIIGEMV